jgi:PhnB protein
MISYENVAAAADWLCDVFGFREHGERYTEPDGALVMLGSPSPDYRSPVRHAEECEQAARWLATSYIVDGVLIYVDDVDGHFEQSRAAGATILSEPEDQPFGRLYRAADLEGHRWMFMTATA